MSNQAQGADGAGTKTAGQVAHDAYWKEPQETDFWNIHPQQVRDGWERAAAAVTALASPRTDSAERAARSLYVPANVRNAFEAADLHECWVNGDTADVMTNPYPGCGNFNQLVARCATGELWRKRAVAIATSLNWIRSLLSEATPAPATPPGVPDSVRALLVEALAQHFHDEEHQHEGYAWVWPEYADDDGRRGNSGYVSITPPVVQMECREAAERITRRLEQFLATHPAGQSAGSGVALECTGCGSRESIEAIQARGFSSCCPERKMQTAPDSTRTGDEGTATYTQAEYDESHEIGRRDGYQEGVQDAAVRVGLDGEYRVSPDPERNVPDPDTMLDRIAERVSALAARPADPEAQGAWNPELVGAERLSTDRKGDVTINVPTALCWLQFRADTSTGKEEDTRPGVGFSLAAYPETHGEWPSGVIPRTEAARLHKMLGDFLARHPAPPASSGQGGR